MIALPRILELSSSVRMVRLVAWLCILAVATSEDGLLIGDAGEENAAPGAAVSAVPAAPPALTESRESNGLLSFLPRPGRRPLRTYLEELLESVRGWLSDLGTTVAERRLQPGTPFPCRPSRRPEKYGVIPSIPPEQILECIKVPSEEIFGVNHRIVDLSFGKFGGLEVLMVAQRRGPVQYVEVIPTGDYAHYGVNRVPLKTFRDHSCLNREMWCFVSQVQPTESGFLVVDRHRVIHYNYTWLLDGSTAAWEVDETYVNHFGLMNTDENFVPIDAKLNFPTQVAEYTPYNASYVTIDYPGIDGVFTEPGYNVLAITDLIPDAWCRLLFVTDTGNHRVMILNASNIGQFDYIGQFGITGETRDNSTGFNWPWGVAVSAPAWESRYEPAYANVFVADRRNHRLVKLNLGYPLLPCEKEGAVKFGKSEMAMQDDEEETWLCRRYDKPRLYYSAEYGQSPDVFNTREGLTDPTNVAVYRHFIVVAEVGGNAITLLRVNHLPPYDLKFVTYFKPVQGVYLQGGMSVSPFGYIWYNYVGTDMKNTFSSMYLPEIIRESVPPNRFTEFAKECVNTTWYNELLEMEETVTTASRDRYINQMQFILNASAINWLFPDRPNYVDMFSFNKTNEFDFELLEQLVYNGSMPKCEAPTTPTPPPFFGGNQDGWVIDGKSQSEFTKRSGTLHSPRLRALLVLTLFNFII